MILDGSIVDINKQNMKIKIALLAGDGIGPEVIDQAVKVSNAVAKKFNCILMLSILYPRSLAR